MDKYQRKFQFDDFDVSIQSPENYIERLVLTTEVLEYIRDFIVKESGQGIINLHSFGGYGKTTLIKRLYFGEEIKEWFDYFFWIDLGEKPEHYSERIKKLLRNNFNKKNIGADIEMSKRVFIDIIKNKKNIFFIDDVRDWEDLEPYMFLKQFAVIVFTTRLDLPDLFGSKYRKKEVGKFSMQEAVSVLMNGINEPCPENLLNNLIETLHAWPLLINLSNIILKNQIESGRKIEGAISFIKQAIKKNGTTSFYPFFADRNKVADIIIYSTLKLLEPLSKKVYPDENRMFLYYRFTNLAIFNDRFEIPFEILGKLWGSPDENQVEITLIHLKSLHLVSIDYKKKTIKIQDVIKEYITQMFKDDALVKLHRDFLNKFIDIDEMKIDIIENNNYVRQFLFYHLYSARLNDKIICLLTNFNFLEKKIYLTNIYALLEDFNFANFEDKSLRIIYSALRRSADVLYRCKKALSAQLIGRLMSHQSDIEILKFIRQIIPDEGFMYPINLCLDQVGGPLIQNMMHNSPVMGAFILNEKYILSYSADNIIKMWNLEGIFIKELPVQSKNVTSIQQLSGESLAICYTGYFLVVSENQSEGFTKVTYQSPAVSGAVELKNGQILSYGDNGEVVLWEASGRAIYKRQLHTGKIKGAIAINDEMYVTWGFDHNIVVDYFLENENTRKLKSHDGEINQVLVYNENIIVSSDAIGRIFIYNIINDESIQVPAHKDEINGILINRNGDIVSWSDDSDIFIWDMNGKKLAALTAHENIVNGVLLLPNDRLLSWSDDRSLIMWSVDGEYLSSFIGHKDEVFGALYIEEDKMIISWSRDRNLIVWDESGRILTILVGHLSYLIGAKVLPSKQILSWSDDCSLRIWSPSETTENLVQIHSGRINKLIELPGDRVASCTNDNKIIIWDKTGKVINTIIQNCSARNFFIGHDRLLYSCSSDYSVRCWDNSWECIKSLIGHTGEVRGGIVLSNGEILTWASDHCILRWPNTDRYPELFYNHKDFINGVLEMPDGRILSWSKSLLIHRVDKHVHLEIVRHKDYINGILITGNNEILTWSADYTMCLCSDKGEKLSEFSGHKSYVDGALELPAGEFVSWSYVDQTVRKWRRDGQLMDIIEEHETYFSLIYSMGEAILLLANSKNEIYFIDINTKKKALLFIADAPIVTLIQPSWDKDLLVAGDEKGNVLFIKKPKQIKF